MYCSGDMVDICVLAGLASGIIVSAGAVLAIESVPPVGVEPTLGTLLGGRPLPLGYGGGFIIPPVELPNRGVATAAFIIFTGSPRAFCIQIAERD